MAAAAAVDVLNLIDEIGNNNGKEQCDPKPVDPPSSSLSPPSSSSSNESTTRMFFKMTLVAHRMFTGILFTTFLVSFLGPKSIGFNFSPYAMIITEIGSQFGSWSKQATLGFIPQLLIEKFGGFEFIGDTCVSNMSWMVGIDRRKLVGDSFQICATFILYFVAAVYTLLSITIMTVRGIVRVFAAIVRIVRYKCSPSKSQPNSESAVTTPSSAPLSQQNNQSIDKLAPYSNDNKKRAVKRIIPDAASGVTSGLSLPDHPQKMIFRCGDSNVCRREYVLPIPTTVDSDEVNDSEDDDHGNDDGGGGGQTSSSVTDSSKFLFLPLEPGVTSDSDVRKLQALYDKSRFNAEDFLTTPQWYNSAQIFHVASNVPGSQPLPATSYVTFPILEQIDTWPVISAITTIVSPQMHTENLLVHSSTITKEISSTSPPSTVQSFNNVPTYNTALAATTSGISGQQYSGFAKASDMISKVIEIAVGDIPIQVDLAKEAAHLRVPLIKAVSWETFLKESGPMDAIAVRGHGPLSNAIHGVQGASRRNSLFSHVGWRAPHDMIWPGGLGMPESAKLKLQANGGKITDIVVGESVIGGGIIGGFDTTPDINGQAANGVQYRWLLPQMLSKENDSSIFFWIKLNKRYRERMDRILSNKFAYTRCMADIIGKPYPLNAFNFMYGLKDHISELLDGRKATDVWNEDDYDLETAWSFSSFNNCIEGEEGDEGGYTAEEKAKAKKAIVASLTTNNNSDDGYQSLFDQLNPFSSSNAIKKMSKLEDHYFCSDTFVQLAAKLGLIHPLYQFFSRQFYPIDLVNDSQLPCMFESICVIKHPQMS